MNLIEERQKFESEKNIYEGAILTFHGVDGYDVYNSSIPFCWRGKQYIYGRVERRSEWARSWVRLFENTGKDEWTLVSNSMIYQLEDPYVSAVGNTVVLGGSHVRKSVGVMETYYGYFYKGTDIEDLYYFTTGPDYMKDIRIVELSDGRIGVFSRPRNEEIRKKFGSESLVGFTIIEELDQLTATVIESAEYLPGLFAKDEWGGSNQAYLLDSGLIGVIGHKCYNLPCAEGDTAPQVYMNISFVVDPAKQELDNLKIIGTRPCYPEGPSKMPHLAEVAFSSGIVAREDGRVDLYSGLNDCQVGRIVIDNPFEGYGNIKNINISQK